MKKAPAGADAFVICARADGAARVLVAIIPVASNHVGVGPVPAEIGLRRVGDDSGPARGQDRAEHDATDELPVIVPVVPIAHIGLIVPVLVPVLIVIVTPVLIIVVIPVFVLLQLLFLFQLLLLLLQFLFQLLPLFPL